MVTTEIGTRTAETDAFSGNVGAVGRGNHAAGHSGAGFDVTYLSYYNFLLFPIIAGTRIWQRLHQRDHIASNGRHDLTMPSLAINSLLQRIFSSERHLIGHARVPLGVSLIVVARAPAQTDSAAVLTPPPSAS